MFKVKRRLRFASKKEKQEQRQRSDCSSKGSGRSGSDGPNQSSMQSSYASGSHIRSILKSASENEDSYSSVNSHSEWNSVSVPTSDSGQSGTTDDKMRSSAAVAANTAIKNNVNPGKNSVLGVGWNTVQVHEYERALGDSPSCSSGAPITYVY
jgi:hypothetical protein